MTEDELQDRVYIRLFDRTYWADVGDDDLVGPFKTQREAEQAVGKACN